MARGGRGKPGTAGTNSIYGTSDDDVLDGFGPSTFLSGGNGNDLYKVDDPGDVVDERRNSGTDTVYSLIDYTLGDNLENLTLAGTENLSGVGNSADNILAGNDGDNTLTGGGGSDQIDGGAGVDTAVFDGDEAGYSFAWIGGDLQVISAVSGTVDVLRNVEFLRFQDRLTAVADIPSDYDDSPAQAIDDTDAATEDTASVVAVLQNDLGNGLTVAGITNGSKGLVQVNPDGTVTYTPNANAIGSDSFTYTITDTMGRLSTATVAVTIAGVNDAPNANPDSVSTAEGSTLTSATGVLMNDTDVDGDPLTVIGAGRDAGLGTSPGASSFTTATMAGGTVTINANGTFTYTPAAGFAGTDSFAYAVGDGRGGSDIATVSLTVNAAPSDPGTPSYYVEGVIAEYDSWRVNYPDAYGTAATVTYAFPSSALSYYDASHTVSTSFVALTDQQQQAVRDVLALIESFSNLTFVETSVEQAEMTFGLADLLGKTGMAFPAQADGVGNSASDVWIDATYAGATFDLGTRPYFTLVHEIGHALGLDHPRLPDAEATQQYTVMTGTPHATMPIWVDSYQLYDVAALQYLYGANTSYAAGDTVYTFSGFNDLIKAVWDGGGHDVFDMSQATHGVTIDLNPGAFSTVAASGSNNVAIAFGTAIEDAVGSGYNDTVTGNDSANRLVGGAGNDILTGGGGGDLFSFGAHWGADTITDFAPGEDRIEITGVGFPDLDITSNGGDTVIAYQDATILLLGVSDFGLADYA